MEQEKKKFPAWAIALITIFVIFFVGIIAVGAAFHYFFGGKRGESLAKRAVGTVVEELIEKASDGKANVKLNLGEKEQEITIKDKQSGEVLAFKAGSELPSDFPKDISIFNPSKFTSHVSVMGMHTLIWETQSPIPVVAAFYQSRMSANGWQVTNNVSAEDGQFLTFNKGNRETMVQIGKEEGKTVFSIVWGKE